MPQAVVHRQFLEIAPKEPEEVRKIWNVVHIFLLAVTAVTGWLTAYTFGAILEVFDFHCILFAVVTVSPNIHNSTRSPPELLSDIIEKCPGRKIERSKWSSNALCNYVQFLHVASMLSSIIWIVFFAISGRGSDVRRRQIIGKSYRLVLPFLFWSAICSLIIFVTNSTLTSGFSQFCTVLENEVGQVEERVCFGKQKISYDIIFHITGSGSPFLHYLIMKIAMNIEFVACFCNALWTCLRIYLIIDYKFFMVTVWKYRPDKERRKKHSVNFQVNDELEMAD